jgi:hypothetical protein
MIRRGDSGKNCSESGMRTRNDRFFVPLDSEAVLSASNTDRLYLYLSFALFAIAVTVVFLTFRHYGASWDEWLQWKYGESVYRYYLSLFQDRSWESTGDLKYYGGVFELIAVLAVRVLPWSVWETRHLITALCGIAGIAACWQTVRLFAGLKAAFWAALLLVLYPSFYGHMFINSKDIPFATMYAWSLYGLVRIALEFPRISTRTTVITGLFIGMTMAVRVGGMILLFYLYVLLAVLFVHLWRKRGTFVAEEIPIAEIGRKIIVRLFFTTAIAYGFMLAFWPFAAGNPFRHPFIALEYLSHISPIASSADYIPTYLFIKLPELVLVLIVIGSFDGIRSLIKSRDGFSLPQAMPSMLLIMSVAIPIIYAMVTRPFIYDEIRHFLFIGPPICCLAGIILAGALVGRLQRFLLIGVIAYLCFHTYLMLRLHPYEYCYYNRFIGGIRGAYSRNLDTDYWVTSYKEGVEELESYLRRRDGAQFEHKTYNILLGPAEWCATFYFPSNFRQVTDRANAQFCLSTTRGHADASYAGIEILAVRRCHIPFAVVKILHERDVFIPVPNNQ